MKKIGLSLIAITLIAFTACKEEKKELTKEVEKTEEVKKEKETKSNSEGSKEIYIQLESKSESEATGKLFFKEILFEKFFRFRFEFFVICEYVTVRTFYDFVTITNFR